MAHSQAQASSATTAKTSTDANLKTLTDLSLELKKAQKVHALYILYHTYILTHKHGKTFDAGIKAHFKDVSKARREMVKVKKAEKALATQKAKNEKRAKKSEELKTKIDPWLVGRIIDHDYPAILAKENEFQDKVWDLLTDAMALDSKIVSSLEDMAAKNAVCLFVLCAMHGWKY